MRDPKLALHPNMRRGIWSVHRRRVGMCSGAVAYLGGGMWLLETIRYYGWVARGFKVRGAFSWNWCPIPSFRRSKMKKKTLDATPAAGGPVHLAPVESDLFSRLPSLVAHCCVTRYDDGDPRRPGWFTTSTVGSSWKVVAKDPDAAAQCTALAASLDDAFALLELLLSSEATPWEPDPFLAKGKKK